MSFIVEIKDIVKKYGNVTAVDNVSFTINGGEFFSLLGPSGCGKTTILRIIGGFIDQNSGTVLISGANMKNIPPNKRNTSMVFQNLALFPHMNVKENIVYGLKKRHIGKDFIEEKLKNILTAVNLRGYERRSISQLSGGQQQRVALARSLIIEPDILLLDEPLASLDKKLRVSMRTELKEIQKRTGTTFLYVTHDQSEAITMSDSIAVMNNGRIIQTGRPDEIYNQPSNTFVADFIGAGNFIPLENIFTESRRQILTTVIGGRILLEKNTAADSAGGIEDEAGKVHGWSCEAKAGKGKVTQQYKNGESQALQTGLKTDSAISDSPVSFALKKLPVFFIRPEKIKISACEKSSSLEPGNKDLVNRYYGKITSVVFEGPDIRIKIFSESTGYITSEIKNLEPGVKFCENDPIEFCWGATEGLILYS
jgi:spermidine/putrescine transport system ATP-binding protein